MSSITISQNGTLFRLDTKNTTYIMQAGPCGYLNHCYYGARYEGDAADFTTPFDSFQGLSFTPYRDREQIKHAPNLAQQECTTFAIGDFRTASVAVRDSLGCNSTEPQFVAARTYKGRPEIKNMPHARVNGDEDVETLEVTLRDPATGVTYRLDYTVFPEQDCIVRSLLIKNTSPQPVDVERAMSFCLDLDSRDFDLLQCPGTYGRERWGIDRQSLHIGNQGFASSRNSSGADHNPAFALAAHNATESTGNVYGFILVYSGSFAVDVEVDPFRSTRITAGINPVSFEWHLEAGETFRTPEAMLTFSADGIGGMSRNCHDFIREHIISPKWAHQPRPVLINNWEGTGMDFDREKILAIAKAGAECDLDMFVLDDGWFGHRDDDKSSLGDWFVYEKKVGSLKSMAESINDMGLKFGLWFEPEMISEDSELHKLHPEWVFTAPGRERTYGRNQLVLNFGIPEVVDYIYDMIEKIIASAPICYMKWDMNRQPAEISNPLLPASRQKESSHRFVLGVYELHRRILERFPDLLIEGCSGGGGRFDAGILYYTPQIWTSDNTRAIHRLFIQGGTSLFYPASAQGAHVPSHSAPLDTRAAVAMAGTFGYEFDSTKLTEDEKAQIREQVKRFKAWRHLVADGDFYRLVNAWEGEHLMNVWQFAAKDGSEAMLIGVCCGEQFQAGRRKVKLQGLDPKRMYQLDSRTGMGGIEGVAEDEKPVFSGEYLMKVGLAQPYIHWYKESALWHFTAL